MFSLNCRNLVEIVEAYYDKIVILCPWAILRASLFGTGMFIFSRRRSVTDKRLNRPNHGTSVQAYKRHTKNHSFIFRELQNVRTRNHLWIYSSTIILLPHIYCIFEILKKNTQFSSIKALKYEICLNNVRNTVISSQKINCISATNRLMLFRETVTLYCENHTKRT
jgi:hypothetical protein